MLSINMTYFVFHDDMASTTEPYRDSCFQIVNPNMFFCVVHGMHLFQIHW